MKTLLFINTARLFETVTETNIQVKVGRKTAETDPIKSQISSNYLVGKRTAQKDAIKYITDDSQMNRYFPYRWSPASLTINNYFYLFFIFIYNKNNVK